VRSFLEQVQRSSTRCGVHGWAEACESSVAKRRGQGWGATARTFGIRSSTPGRRPEPRRSGSGSAWRPRSYGRARRASGAPASRASRRLQTRSGPGLSAGLEAEPDVAMPRCRAAAGIEASVGAIWTFLDRNGLTFKKDRPRDRAGPPRRSEPAGSLVREPARPRPGPARVYRRDLDVHQHGRLRGRAGGAPPGRRPHGH
jgi:hypothetical protein